MSVKGFYCGKGWQTENIIRIEIDEEDFKKMPVTIAKNGRKVRHVVVGKRLIPDKEHGTTHYVAKDKKIDGQG